MTTTETVFLTLVFLLAVPLNVYVALAIHKQAWPKPRIDLLILLSRLVSTLTGLSIVLSILAVNSLIVLTTGIRIIPMSISTLALIGTLLIVSGINFLTLGYLLDDDD